MTPSIWAILFAVLLTAGLIVTVAARPIALRGAGLLLAMTAFVVLPLSVTAAGAWAHLERSKSTAFCLSCHEMEPYGRSLAVDDADALPANHMQNHRVPPERACYACHTAYTLFGDLQAKIKGVQHLWVHYRGPLPATIELYEPYLNRECLACHAGARSFEESVMHTDIRADLASEAMSCLECHPVVHDIAGLDDASFWHPPAGHGP